MGRRFPGMGICRPARPPVDDFLRRCRPVVAPRGVPFGLGTEMTSRRLMQLIEVAATRSGHPNIVFAAISLVVSALTILTLRCLIEVFG